MLCLWSFLYRSYILLQFCCWQWSFYIQTNTRTLVAHQLIVMNFGCLDFLFETLIVQKRPTFQSILLFQTRQIIYKIIYTWWWNPLLNDWNYFMLWHISSIFEPSIIRWPRNSGHSLHSEIGRVPFLFICMCSWCLFVDMNEHIHKCVSVCVCNGMLIRRKRVATHFYFSQARSSSVYINVNIFRVHIERVCMYRYCVCIEASVLFSFCELYTHAKQNRKINVLSTISEVRALYLSCIHVLCWKAYMYISFMV